MNDNLCSGETNRQCDEHNFFTLQIACGIYCIATNIRWISSQQHELRDNNHCIVLGIEQANNIEFKRSSSRVFLCFVLHKHSLYHLSRVFTGARHQCDGYMLEKCTVERQKFNSIFRIKHVLTNTSIADRYSNREYSGINTFIAHTYSKLCECSNTQQHSLT